MTSRTLLRPLVLLAVVAGCGADGGTDAADADPVRTTEVRVVDNDFEPASIAVDAGATVVWTWEGDNPHDVRGDGFASEIQQQGTFRHTFEEPGDYEYRCTVHPAMRARVVVR